ncbi:MAG: triose-phosphate isomerase [Deltaproteobacteria bacterium]|nr:triose-phosphate isomerase [Deltaproteobacteria bacterium]
MTIRRHIIGNWKMHFTAAQAAEIAGALAKAKPPADVTAGVAPGFLHLAQVARALSGTPWIVGAQDCSDRPEGAATGQVACTQIRDAGGVFAVIGHSERRQQLKERSPLINAKISAALEAGLVPLVCVGETGTERGAGLTVTVLDEQIRGAFLDLTPEQVGRCWIAYEPVWAIGTGQTATAEQIAAAHGHIRQQVVRGYGKPAETVPVLYGGSVSRDNSAEILGIKEVDGLLVGGASLKASDFTAIVGCG